MGGFGRSIAGAVAAALTAVLVAGTGQAGAVTALIMGGTGQPDPSKIPGDYINTVGRLYIDPVSSCKVGTCQLHPTITPEEFWPFFTAGMTFNESVQAGLPMLDVETRHYLGLDSEPLIIFGNSQSATVATEEKRDLVADPTVDTSRLQFVLIGDPNRPNGGFLQRFLPITIPIFGYRPTTSPVDTGGPTTTDISFQYDIAGDFPTYPLNAFAMLNTVIGIGIHGSYTSTRDGYSEPELLAAINDPANRQVVGNTTYITLPTKVLPLAQAIRDTGYTLGLRAITTPLADLVEPTLRVLVELGYNRSAGYGKQVSFGLFPTIGPGRLVHELLVAAGRGVHNAFTGDPAYVTPQPAAAAPKLETEPVVDEPDKTTTVVSRVQRLGRGAEDKPADRDEVEDRVDSVGASENTDKQDDSTEDPDTDKGAAADHDTDTDKSASEKQENTAAHQADDTDPAPDHDVADAA